MAKSREVPAITEKSTKVAISENELANVKMSFAGEAIKLRETIENRAKLLKMDKYTLYASILFQERLDDRLTEAKATHLKVMSSAAEVQYAQGLFKTLTEARKHFGLVDESADE